MDNTIYRLGKLLLHYLHCHVNAVQQRSAQVSCCKRYNSVDAMHAVESKHWLDAAQCTYKSCLAQFPIEPRWMCSNILGYSVVGLRSGGIPEVTDTGFAGIATSISHRQCTSRCGGNNVISPTRLKKWKFIALSRKPQGVQSHNVAFTIRVCYPFTALLTCPLRNRQVCQISKAIKEIPLRRT